MQKRTAIVTGGSSGIGEAIVKNLTQSNYQVFNMDIAPPQQTLANATFVQCDVRDAHAVNTEIAAIGDNYNLDALVINAGKHLSANIAQTTDSDFDAIMKLNVYGAFHVLRACITHMQQAKRGSVVIVSSDQALVAKSNSFAYNLSKSALASMAKTTALDYAADNIRVNAVCPGTIDTPLYQQAIKRYCDSSGADPAEVHAQEAALQPLNRIGQASEVADLVAFLLSDKATFITGSLQVIDGGYTVA